MMRRLLAALGWCLALAGAGGSEALALDLETALRQAADANPMLSARRAMVEAARRRVAPAGAWASPMVELGVINVPTNGRLDMDPMTMKMVGITQRIPAFGSNRLARRSAVQALEAESAGARMAGFEILGETWEAYAGTFFAGELARHAEAHQGVMDRLVQSARSRYESGNGRLEDVLRAEAERARVLADLASFRAEERTMRARLDALRGASPGASGEALAPPPAPAPTSDAGPWLAALDGSHPRLREMDAQVGRYRFAARAARRMAWPDLELRGSYGRREPLEGGIPQDNMFSAMVGFMLPLFAGQREFSEGAEMDAMARAAEAERRGAELELREQIQAAWSAAEAAHRTERLMADTVVATQQRAVEASWVSYRAGATDLWRVFEATHALYGEQIALTRARQELARAQGRLLSLTGRGDLLGVVMPGNAGSER